MDSKMRASGMCAALVAGAALLSACGASGGADSSSGTILVGTSVGLSGPSAAGCKPTGDGVGAWLKHVNSEGGVNGHKFKQIVKDDATDPTRTVANVRGLAADKVVHAWRPFAEVVQIHVQGETDLVEIERADCRSRFLFG